MKIKGFTRIRAMPVKVIDVHEAYESAAITVVRGVWPFRYNERRIIKRNLAGQWFFINEPYETPARLQRRLKAMSEANP